MISVVYTAVCEGIEGLPVQVETDIGPGLPQINIVGLASTTVMESRERIKSGLLNSGFEYPRRRVTVNLIPAGIRKNGSHLDLAIAMGILGAMGYADADALREIGFIGEISLQGDVCRVEGVLPMILGMEKAGIRRVVLPAENLAEAELAREGGSAGPENAWMRFRVKKSRHRANASGRQSGKRNMRILAISAARKTPSGRP